MRGGLWTGVEEEEHFHRPFDDHSMNKCLVSSVEKKFIVGLYTSLHYITE